MEVGREQGTVDKRLIDHCNDSLFKLLVVVFLAYGLLGEKDRSIMVVLIIKGQYR